MPSHAAVDRRRTQVLRLTLQYVTCRVRACQAALETCEIFPYSCAMNSQARVVRAMVVSVGPHVPLVTKQLLSVTKTFFASQHWLYRLSTDFAGSSPIRAPPHSWMAAPSAMLFLNDRRNMNRSNHVAFGNSLS